MKSYKTIQGNVSRKWAKFAKTCVTVIRMLIGLFEAAVSFYIKFVFSIKASVLQKKCACFV